MFIAALLTSLLLLALPAAAQTDSAKYNPLPFSEVDEEPAPQDGRTHGSAPTDYSLPATNNSSLLTPHSSLKKSPALALRFAPQTVLALDEYVRTWLKGRENYSLSLEAQYDTHCRDNGSTAGYASDYGYPTFALGLRYNFSHGTTMHRDAADWGDMEVPYTTRMGDILTLYGRFDRPIFRTRRWRGGYSIGLGCGYAMSHYDTTEHIDNELIGTRLNIFFTAGLFLHYQMAPHWALTAGLDFSHHSNGALYRPNKGANYLGPFIGLTYSPQPCDDLRPAAAKDAEKGYNQTLEPQNFTPHPSNPQNLNPQNLKNDFRRHPFFLEFSIGVGAKTLNEEWQRTQYYVPATDPDYRTSHFAVYGAYSLQTDVMYRYARRWASGLGIDLFYGDYASALGSYDGNEGDHISPWSLALAFKHEAYYGRLTARVGIGVYLYRHMGTLASQVEQPYYERVGLFYTLDRRSGLAVGFSVNAHKTKADFTELSLSIPIRL